MDSALLISIPMVGIYMPLYDHLAERFSSLGMYSPIVAGVTARTAAIFCVAPLELARTRQQATSTVPISKGGSPANGVRAGAPAAATTWEALKSSLGLEQAPSHRSGKAVHALKSVPQLWTGFAATMARDVPFSAIYWGLLEPIRGAILSNAAGTSSGGHRGSTAVIVEDEMVELVPQTTPSNTSVLFANMVAGSVAGACAAAATTPFDVVKTRLQIAVPAARSGSNRSTWNMMKHVWDTEGIRGLFTGVGPRAARCAPACAIVISCYELLKKSL